MFGRDASLLCETTLLGGMCATAVQPLQTAINGFPKVLQVDRRLEHLLTRQVYLFREFRTVDVVLVSLPKPSAEDFVLILQR